MLLEVCPEPLVAAVLPDAELADIPLQSLVATKALTLAPNLPAIRAARVADKERLSALVGTPANPAAVHAFAARWSKRHEPTDGARRG